MNSAVTEQNIIQLFSRMNETIDSAQTILVASHIDPDGDALGTQLAFAAYLKSIDKQVILVRDGNIPDKYLFLPGVNEIPYTSEEFLDALEFDTAIILECPDPKRIGRTNELLDSSVRILNIDHHLDNANFGAVNWINSSASSVGEMVYEYFAWLGYKINPDVATSLFTAIMTDTGRFRFDSTSARTLQISGELVASGARPQMITDQIYFSMQPQAMKLVGKILNNIEYYFDGKLCVLMMTDDMLKETGASRHDSEGIVDFTLFTKGVDAGLFIKEDSENSVKASLRSRDGVNVASIAGTFGGGGHFNAAGCTIELPIETAKSRLLELFGEVFNGA
ncbi:MAG: bifunctional oligoribonuclease/PAP phosphatase NrnA [bacterium]|nr:bifunctional oligoribonuclease/PAP phosphatase NrnA [bacterium]